MTLRSQTEVVINIPLGFLDVTATGLIPRRLIELEDTIPARIVMRSRIKTTLTERLRGEPNRLLLRITQTLSLSDDVLQDLSLASARSGDGASSTTLTGLRRRYSTRNIHASVRVKEAAQITSDLVIHRRTGLKRRPALAVTAARSEVLHDLLASTSQLTEV